MSFETAVKLFNDNPMHYLTSKKLVNLISRLKSPLIVEIRLEGATNTFDYLKGDDVLSFCNFIDEVKPKYILKRVTEFGVIYEYGDRYV